MGLKASFVKGVNTIFTVFKEAVKDGEYTITTNNGFDGEEVESCPIRIILDSFKKDDAGAFSFEAMIQATDVKGLVPGEDLTIEVKTGTAIVIGERELEVVAFDTDPFNVMYTFLLRDSA